MRVHLSEKYWYNKDNIWVRGFIRKGEMYLIEDELINYFSGIESIMQFEQKLIMANGQFSVVIITLEGIWAATDRLRNFPLFYSKQEGKDYLSDNCYSLIKKQEMKRLNKIAVNCFLSAGYVLNNLTLLDGIYQVEAGQYVIIGDSIKCIKYDDTSWKPIKEIDFKTGADELLLKIHEVFRSHLAALKNKFIAIPLSGGFDSRLIAAMCAEYHPENVICFTYGAKNNPEVIPAQKTAERLGLKWINIVYDQDLIKGFISDKYFNDYYPYASNLSGMFYMQDYFAVRYLKQNNIIPDNSVFIPGFSGDMLAGSHLLPSMKNKLKKRKIAELIFAQYFLLIKTDKKKKSEIIAQISSQLPEENYETWKVVEAWDLKERQAKFVVNSSKIFSYFGYDYVMPLWDNQLIDFFSELPFQLKLNKKLYDHVLTEVIFKQYNLNFKNEINVLPIQKRVQRIKEKLKTFIPDYIINIFVQRSCPVLYDKITELMIADLGPDSFIPPRQANVYNSYITQWYLLKTKEFLS